ncbi:MAG: hypothetical protein GY699_24590, partial [Desulfobacteraceae bacterium]|nr:hypothetical protein [Desulfobacteraceae bacterium]
MKAKHALNKSTFILFFIVATITTSGFEIAVGQSKETPSPVLTIGQTSLLKIGSTGIPSKAENGVFAAGDMIILVLKNVGTFKKNSNGEYWYDIDFSIESSEGIIAFSKEGYLGDYGKGSLPNGILEKYNIQL